jgi:hypothetical protein
MKNTKLKDCLQFLILVATPILSVGGLIGLVIFLTKLLCSLFTTEIAKLIIVCIILTSNICLWWVWALFATAMTGLGIILAEILD